MSNWYKKSQLEEVSRLVEDEIRSLAVNLEKDIKKLIISVDLSAASKKALEKSSKSDIKRIRIGKIGDFNIFIVNGDKVKTNLEMEFVEGGNDQAYSSDTDTDQKDVIPKNEIWLSAEIRPEFLPYILLHEILESIIMEKTHSDYESAHDTANIFEKRAREARIFG